jgi:hypothetical protein
MADLEYTGLVWCTQVRQRPSVVSVSHTNDSRVRIDCTLGNLAAYPGYAACNPFTKNVSVRRGCIRENTSVLMAVSASGVMIPPLFIFKGKRVPSNLLHGSPPASKVKVSDNAFVDTDIFDQWIDHFIESIPAARPVLLTLDNHSAHIALHVRRKCIANGIHLMSFPPHMTHILQLPVFQVELEEDRRRLVDADTWSEY